MKINQDWKEMFDQPNQTDFYKMTLQERFLICIPFSDIYQHLCFVF